MQSSITITSWTNNTIWPKPDGTLKDKYYATLVKLNKDLFPTLF
jgi:hypothetical protein